MELETGSKNDKYLLKVGDLAQLLACTTSYLR